MAKSGPSEKNACCSMEKARLVEDLRCCDFNSTSLEQRHDCYRRAAKESGQRSKACMISRPIF